MSDVLQIIFLPVGGLPFSFLFLKLINLFLKYLFIYLAAMGLCCGTRDVLVAACGIFSCSMWDLVP